MAEAFRLGQSEVLVKTCDLSRVLATAIAEAAHLLDSDGGRMLAGLELGTCERLIGRRTACSGEGCSLWKFVG